MNIDISGKTALVSGSTAGIGLATAKALASAGAAVIINGRDQPAVDAAIAAVKGSAPSATVRGIVADVATASGCDGLFAAEEDVDILVNNAGAADPKDFFDIEDDQWDRMFALNVLSSVRLSRSYLPGMMRRDWGRVILLSSESALNLPVEMIDYGVTKTAVLGLARALAKRMAGTSVTVNAVLPGPTLSEGLAKMLGADAERSGKPIEQVAAEFVRAARPSSIIRRAASVDEVANLIAYVASPLSSATTGACLRVDGGVVDTIA